jgi:hypothetical protein
MERSYTAGALVCITVWQLLIFSYLFVACNIAIFVGCERYIIAMESRSF